MSKIKNHLIRTTFDTSGGLPDRVNTLLGIACDMSDILEWMSDLIHIGDNKLSPQIYVEKHDSDSFHVFLQIERDFKALSSCIFFNVEDNGDIVASEYEVDFFSTGETFPTGTGVNLKYGENYERYDYLIMLLCRTVVARLFTDYLTPDGNFLPRAQAPSMGSI